MSQAHEKSGEVVAGNPGPDAIGPYSLGRVASGQKILFVSGQVAWDTNGAIVGVGNVGEQYRQIMRIIKAIVEDAGGTMSDVCKIVNYMTITITVDAPEYQELSKARLEFFPDKLPASTMVEVARLGDPDALVEVDAIAVFD